MIFPNFTHKSKVNYLPEEKKYIFEFTLKVKKYHPVESALNEHCNPNNRLEYR